MGSALTNASMLAVTYELRAPALLRSARGNNVSRQERAVPQNGNGAHEVARKAQRGCSVGVNETRKTGQGQVGKQPASSFGVCSCKTVRRKKRLAAERLAEWGKQAHRKERLAGAAAAAAAADDKHTERKA